MTAAIKREQAFWILRTMRLVRQTSERIAKLYPTDVMETPVHLCIGQEAVSAGLCCHLEDEDKLLPGHRTHGPALAKGLPLQSLMAELYGRTTGCSHARGGSMHVFDPDHGIPGSSAIVGGSIAVGVGAALSSSLQNAEFISVAYFGDAATNAGVFYESMNFAALKKLPVLFLCENNGVSNVMPIAEHAAYDIGGVASQFMPYYSADGTDALAVYAAAGEAVGHVRKTRRPVFLECSTKRWMNHQGHGRDDGASVDPEKDCPIVKLERFMLQSGMATRRELSEVELETERQIDAAIEFAERSPYPEVKSQEV